MVTVVNNYAPPTKDVKTTEELLNPPEGVHDMNFVLPVKELDSGKVRLVPFIPTVHMPLLMTRSAAHPELFKYVGYGPLTDLVSSLHIYDRLIASDPSSTWFAVFDLTRPDKEDASLPGAFAGVTGLLAASAAQSQAEIGYVLYLPEFQRTHVGTHATGLLMHYLLDSPSLGGLGLRRAQWKANALNTRSVEAAKRLGFRDEGVSRWHIVLPEGKEGLDRPDEGDGARGKGRHTAMLSVCWDDWKEGVREKVDALMSRN
ncbi:hypothetical protein DACRYDRAFT_22170 [Dacryopinax primogenitus]|uniref:N-acetyltransferase domain-containing protein n=1 Tax=Dacryopinax primogenitus (strain DJM 731) TaxID=1858805 RepID=M5GCH2_DACPD|nr:uncharacterized protein DACRYDRAFT_22170 [Dacryopinax primogenitus]EJU01773.1 hypothetical protein DACRYDRAFT_22170 [Dacryopinax primogenitus]